MPGPKPSTVNLTAEERQCFIINFEVATGQVVTPSYGYTRTEEDFVNHIKRLVESDPSVIKWHEEDQAPGQVEQTRSQPT